MEVLEKQVSDTYVQKWEKLRTDIMECYSRKDKQAVNLMKSAVSLYEELLRSSGKTFDPVTNEETFLLLPLNGEERLAFIKEKIHTPYSLIQLHALFTETIKKAARLRSLG